MSGTFPRRGIMYNTAIQPHDVLARAHEVGPECILDIPLQLDAQRPVVEESREAVVYFAGGEDDAASFAQRDDVFHFQFGVIVLGLGRRRRLRRGSIGLGLIIIIIIIIGGVGGRRRRGGGCCLGGGPDDDRRRCRRCSTSSNTSSYRRKATYSTGSQR